MKIIVSSTGPDLQDTVDPRFGRAAFLIIYDTDTSTVAEVINNREGQEAGQGAGIKVAGLVAQKGVKAVVTGRVGPKAMAVLDKAGIEVIDNAKGTVQQALADLAARSSSGPCGAMSVAENPESRGGGRRRKRGQGLFGGSGMGQCVQGRGRSQVG